jgi:hypothetical protein
VPIFGESYSFAYMLAETGEKGVSKPQSVDVANIMKFLLENDNRLLTF